jgi:Pyruvate/2-oxoacid:ferredoxin oxidoreductase delta subunit
MYEKLIIYYFTGTGNALAATNWIAQIAIKKDIQVEIKKITPSLKVVRKEISENTLIGFCYPTHGFNAPPIVINFLLRYPKMGNRVFLLNTRAGMKISKLFVPGLSGLAQLLPAIILLSKGHRIVGLQPMDLPSNWISIHPGLRPKVINSIFERCEGITKRFAKNIIAGKKTYQGLVSLPIDLFISPVSVGYYFFGRFALAKTFIAGSNCNGCALCEKECPVKAISMKNDRPFWTRKCESCMHCMNSCPQRVIQTPHLFVVILWWLVFSVIPLFITKELVNTNPYFSEYFNLAFNTFVLITGLPIIFFSYRILFFLMKFKFFNWLIMQTSLTKFRFWRRYKAPKEHLKKDLKVN